MVLDNVASEVHEKVKSAIKAKLTELGVYVDDELPDYIMILVGNKKTKDQMDDDLSLFLGHNTERFTSWLHNVLEKLNAASVLQTEDSKTGKEEKKKKEESKVVDSKEPKPVEEKKKHKKKKDKSEKKKEKKEKKKKKDKEKHSKSQKHKDKEPSSSKSKSPELENDSDEASSQNATEESVPNISKKVLGDSNTTAAESVKKYQVSTSVASAEAKNEEEVPNDVVNLRPNEEDLALGLEEETNVKKLKLKPESKENKEDRSSNSIPQPLNIEIKVDNTNVREITNETSDSEVTTSGVQERVGPKRIINLREESTFPSKTSQSEGMGRVVSSAIASAVKSVSASSVGKASDVKTGKKLEARVRPLVSSRLHSEETNFSDSVPPRVVSTVGAVLKRSHSNDSDEAEEPPSKRLTGIASKVEVTPRPRRPGSIQANTALILRAVADAHKSVNKPARKTLEDKDEENPKKEIFTKSYQERQQQRLSNSGEAKSIKKFAITVPNSLLKENIEDNLSGKSTFNEAYINEIEMDTQSIITKEATNQDVKNVKQKVLPQLKKFSSTPMQMDESNGSTRFIVTLDGFGNEVTSNDLRSRISGRPVRTPSVDEEEFIEEVEEWEEEIEEMEGITPQVGTIPDRSSASALNYGPKWKVKIDASDLESKKDERCRYWPSCKEGTACQYIHPNKMCITFPNCKFGDKCIYIHPNCKFNSGCTKPNCPYTHTLTRSLGIVGNTSLVKSKVRNPKTKIKCRFYPKCKDMNCPYMHPKQICRYGKACQTPSCMYVHPEVTTGSLLKWTAPKPKEQSLADPSTSKTSTSSVNVKGSPETV